MTLHLDQLAVGEVADPSELSWLLVRGVEDLFKEIIFLFLRRGIATCIFGGRRHAVHDRTELRHDGGFLY